MVRVSNLKSIHLTKVGMMDGSTVRSEPIGIDLDPIDHEGRNLITQVVKLIAAYYSNEDVRLPPSKGDASKGNPSEPQYVKVSFEGKTLTVPADSKLGRVQQALDRFKQQPRVPDASTPSPRSTGSE